MTWSPEWQRNLPAGWELVQLRRVAAVRNGADYTDVEVSEGGYPVYGSGGEFRRASSYLYDGDSVLFGRKGTIDRPLLVAGRFWTVDTMFYTELSPQVDAGFLHYYATTMPFGYYSTSTALPSMTQGDLGSHRIPLPAVEVQRMIRSYLDRETAQIDELIVKQKKLIEVLRERSSVVREAGFATVVGSGHRLKTVLAEIDQRAGGQVGRQLPLLSVSIVSGVSRRLVDSAQAASEDLSHYKVVRADDIVVNRMRAFQGALGVAREDGIVSPDYAVLRCAPDIDPTWLSQVMRTAKFVAEMTSRLKGIGGTEGGAVRTPRINVVDLLEIRVAVPARSVQLESVEADSLARESCGRLTDKAERFIELSKERRAALITAAVTGQIDVQGATT
ncbi:MAG TPA: restriction endonuclease subunit S [Gordonia sp. (in: high G+C Gram-positive bacteria)]|uniref:restriction endonuclease subunit S n=1 Tax=unclassified Gordonia (in: high G+C Gram-positive bacteria) TaxID=2657482 RepID=UPI0025B9EAF4|nr:MULTISPECIES: restriction endonuclease subunit S [unclassified Gordonia (in: high G+C Gram-positive bacteria)]HNP58766.1 restriction endonuclease subunit S [Gordonia sp. (in: high G+C Gram-positive bacteria)]HRC52443.1 restriction endonuclease subunit S [Gordonia sp. (in: high G+C Gram-positive bacteria)]